MSRLKARSRTPTRDSRLGKAVFAFVVLCLRLVTHPFPGSILIFIAAIHLVEAESSAILKAKTSEVLVASVPLLAHFEPLWLLARELKKERNINVSFVSSMSVKKQMKRRNKKLRKHRKRSSISFPKLGSFNLTSINWITYENPPMSVYNSLSLESDVFTCPEPILLSLAHQDSLYRTLMSQYLQDHGIEESDAMESGYLPKMIVSDRFCFGAIHFAKKFSIPLVLVSPSLLLGVDNPPLTIPPPFVQQINFLPDYKILKTLGNIVQHIGYSNMMRSVLLEIRRFGELQGIEERYSPKKLYSRGSVILSQTSEKDLDAIRPIHLPSFFHVGLFLSETEYQNFKAVQYSSLLQNWFNGEVLRIKFTRNISTKRKTLAILPERFSSKLIKTISTMNARLGVKTLYIPNLFATSSSPRKYVKNMLFSNRTSATRPSLLDVELFCFSSGDYNVVQKLFSLFGSPVFVVPSSLIALEVGLQLERNLVGNYWKGNHSTSPEFLSKLKTFYVDRALRYHSIKHGNSIRQYTLSNGFPKARYIVNSFLSTGHLPRRDMNLTDSKMQEIANEMMKIQVQSYMFGASVIALLTVLSRAAGIYAGMVRLAKAREISPIQRSIYTNGSTKTVEYVSAAPVVKVSA